VTGGPLRCLATMISAVPWLSLDWVVELVPVDEQHHIGVLLDGPGLPQVGEHGRLS